MALFKRRAETGKYQNWFDLSKNERELDKKAFQAALDAYKKVYRIGNWEDLKPEDKEKVVREILDCLTYMEERLASGDKLAVRINKDVAAAGCTLDQAFKTASLLTRRQDVRNYGSDRRRGFRTVTYKQPTEKTGGGGGGGGGRRRGGRGGNASATAIAMSEATASIGDIDVNVNIPTRGPGFGNIHGRILHKPEVMEVGTRRRLGVPGAIVYLEGTGYPPVTTDPQGYYIIPNVRAGTYSVVAQHYGPFVIPASGPTAQDLTPYAPYGYAPNQADVTVKPDEDVKCDIELEAIEREGREPKRPKPGYHIISSKWADRKKFPIIGKFLNFYKRPCPECKKHTLVEGRDEKTGTIYFYCANKDCPAAGYERTPDEIDIGKKGRYTPFLGLRARERADKRLVWEEKMRKLNEKYRKDEITDAQFEAGKKKINNEVYGKCPGCKQTSLSEEKDARGVIFYRCSNPQCEFCINNVKIRPDWVQKYRKGFVTRVGGPMAKWSRGVGEEVRKGIFTAAIIGIGAVISAIFGNMWFFFGFLSVGLYVLTPSPDSGKFEEGPMGWGHIMPWAQGGTHAGYSWIKSITKVSAIICFAYGFKSMGDVFNLFFMITCLGGYFSLKIGYDPKKPGEFIESLLRFGVLGCYFIPFYLFVSIFNSYVLGIIAFAFFAIPPMPKTEGIKDLTEVLAQGLSGQTAYYEMFDKILFSVLMLLALLGSGSLGVFSNLFGVGWKLEGTLAYTFIYFWLISAIGGFFSPARERPLTGILFLGGATIIYGIGPGSQDIGSALLGQWWPSVNQAVTTISEPIGKMFGQLGKTFGDAFLLLTNPVGYATQLMNGSYANNPVGETGPIGVELSGFDVTPVFIEQPFMITANVKNNGGYDAQNVGITLTAGYWSPERKIDMGVQTIPGVVRLKISQIGMDLTSCANTKDKDSVCTHYYDSATEPSDAAPKNFTRQNIWQTVFSSNGIKCDITSSYDLRKKSIPINITLTYKYQTDSTLGKGTDKLEFISQAEWDRLARLDQLNTRLKTILSESTSGPVLFPIGTPGLKSPILETQDFHIALSLRSQQAGGRIQSIESVVLNYPTEFPIDTCTPDASTGIWSMDKGTPGKVIWTPKSSSTPVQGDTMFFCHFKSFKGEGRDVLKGTPTKSYIITAHANYIYSNSKEKLVKVEFGSWCCAESLNPKGECASSSKCCSEQYPGQSKGKGICIPSEQNCGGGWISTSGCCQNANDAAWFCSDVNSADKCTELGSRFILNGVCQTTGPNIGKCEGCAVYDGDQNGCNAYSSQIAGKALKCEYSNGKCNTVAITIP